MGFPPPGGGYGAVMSGYGARMRRYGAGMGGYGFPPPPDSSYGARIGGYGAGMRRYGAGMGGYGVPPPWRWLWGSDGRLWGGDEWLWGGDGWLWGGDEWLWGSPPPPAAVMGRSIVAVSVWVGGNTLGGAPRLPHRGWGVRGVPGGRWGTIGRYGVLMGHNKAL